MDRDCGNGTVAFLYFDAEKRYHVGGSLLSAALVLEIVWICNVYFDFCSLAAPGRAAAGAILVVSDRLQTEQANPSSWPQLLSNGMSRQWNSFWLRIDVHAVISKVTATFCAPIGMRGACRLRIPVRRRRSLLERAFAARRVLMGRSGGRLPGNGEVTGAKIWYLPVARLSEAPLAL